MPYQIDLSEALNHPPEHLTLPHNTIKVAAIATERTANSISPSNSRTLR